MSLDLFRTWHYRTETDDRASVFPDGCRDVLVVREPGRAAKIVQTDLDLRPRLAELAAGTQITGYRLPPGGLIGSDTLAIIANAPEKADDIIGNELVLSHRTEDAIAALARPLATVQSVATDLGVSIRTLQRWFLSQNLPAPDYWRLLARARLAAERLTGTQPLTDIACDTGFSDQAHMTRAFQRWFGCTPFQMRADPSLLDLATQPALGNWTGEQISTR